MKYAESLWLDEMGLSGLADQGKGPQDAPGLSSVHSQNKQDFKA